MKKVTFALAYLDLKYTLMKFRNAKKVIHKVMLKVGNNFYFTKRKRDEKWKNVKVKCCVAQWWEET